MKKKSGIKNIFIIAEISSNHNNNFLRTKKLIKAISKTGVDAVKFQTFEPDEMTLNINNRNFKINEKKSLWKGRKLFDLYKESSMNWQWQKKLFTYARKCKLLPFSTPFGENSLKFLKRQKCKIYKIASLENSHFPLLKSLAKTGKPIIISTGSATEKEIEESIKYLRHNGCKDITILKCTSVYPAKPSDLNLSAIPYLKKKFNCKVGFSDHSKGITSTLAAIAIGAEVIEKHVKLNENDKSLDSKFSITVKELKDLVLKANQIKESMGKNYFLTKSEKYARSRRRSIITIRNISKNERLSEKNIKVLRPNIGLNPKYYEYVIGKKINRQIKIGSPIKISFLKKK
tara:strand:- start:31309 stop:32343 length:1035 start_codon:yes stop_codon:yes gene_type:complete